MKINLNELAKTITERERGKRPYGQAAGIYAKEHYQDHQ